MNLADPRWQQDTIALEALRVVARKRLKPAVVEQLKVNVYPDRLFEEMVVELETAVYVQRIADAHDFDSKTVTFMVPATTWAMFKDRHAQSWWFGWWVKRRPPKLMMLREKVKLHTHWTGYATFPDMAEVIQHSTFGQPVFVSIQRREP